MRASADDARTPVVLFPAFHFTKLLVTVRNQSVDPACPRSGSFEDWFLYRRLAAAGHYGHAIPERLLRYRVRRESMLREVGMPRLARLEGEMLAHEREQEVAWTSKSA